jgi:hypothetical protein
MHAKISLIDGCLHLEDFKSKFGTLIQVQSDLVLLPGKHIAIQDKSTTYYFHVLRKMSFYLLCKWYIIFNISVA